MIYDKKTSYVYVMQAGYKGPYKIGKSNDVEKRINQLQTGNHLKINLVLKIVCKSEQHAFFVEKELHKSFDKHQLEGEWFSSDISMHQIKNKYNNVEVSYNLKTIRDCSQYLRLIGVNRKKVEQIIYEIKYGINNHEYNLPTYGINKNMVKEIISIVKNSNNSNIDSLFKSDEAVKWIKICRDLAKNTIFQKNNTTIPSNI